MADTSELVAYLQEALRRSDWTAVQETAAALVSSGVPSDRGEIAVYLDHLQHTLVLTKNARMNAVAALGRIRAASIFNASGSETVRNRHNFGDSPGF